MNALTRTEKNRIYDVIVIFVTLVSLGFPGNYAGFIGEGAETAAEYSAFVLQAAVMLFSSGESFRELRLISMRPRYRSVYLLTAVFFVESMLVTRYPGAQLITCLRFSVTVFFALWLVERYAAGELLELVCYAQFLFVAASILMIVVSPQTAFAGGNGAFIGILPTKNTAAGELSCGILMQMILYRIRKDEGRPVGIVFLAFLVLQIFLLLSCRAAGAVLFAAVPVWYILFQEKRRGVAGRLRPGLLYILVSVGFLAFAMTILPVFEPVFAIIGKDATLTGRTVLWRRIISMMLQTHTWTGYGYEMFWRDARAVALYHSGFKRDSWGSMMTTGAHNVLLEFWLNTGLVGIAAYFIMLLDATKRIRELPEPQYLFCSAFLLHTMMHGLTERAFGTYNYFTLFFFMAMGAACQKPASRGRIRRIWDETTYSRHS